MKVTVAAPLVLGSRSPRRLEILISLGVPCEVRPADVDEAVAVDEPAGPYLERVCAAKLAAAGAALGVPRVVLVADTSVIVDGDILGKPANAEEAAAMIARLAGRSHEVWTRFAIGASSDREAEARRREAADLLHAETVRTRVAFRALSVGAIRRYAATGEGLDKAGAYAIQGKGSGLVSRIEGSYTNVVGLPACEVSVALERLGLFP